jgi:2-polyprenyl-3-methyl-5-hydroxy-6-metoxy-1,4-benzoquinol methylase
MPRDVAQLFRVGAMTDEDLIKHIAALLDERLPHKLDELLWQLGRRTVGVNPNTVYFNQRFRTYELALLNIKQLGYELGRQLAREKLSKAVDRPSTTSLASKLCTQADMESDWLAFWCREIKAVPFYHRKLWELCYIAQAVYASGKLAPGKLGLAFGCGQEPLPALFAKYGCSILATDLAPSDVASKSWIATSQHATSVDKLRRRDICPDPTALARINYRFVNMNVIPDDLAGLFDFCWSACALEHIGSIDKGLAFIENSLFTLKPGGVAVHTTEFNLDDSETIDQWATVLFQRRHFEALAAKLTVNGHKVAPLDFSGGNDVLDGFVDVPPWLPRADAHLKLSVDGFPCTSIGLIVTKAA